MDRPLHRALFALRALALGHPEMLNDDQPDPLLPTLAEEPAMDAGQPPSQVGCSCQQPATQTPPVIADRIELLGQDQPWPTDLPKLTEVQRLRLEPGDALVVKIGHPAQISQTEAVQAERLIRAKLGLPVTTRILVIGGRDSIEVIAGGE